MNFIPPQDETRLRAAASGVLPNGKTCVVNSDGTVSVVASSSVSASTGSATVFTNNEIEDLGISFDTENNKVLIVYRDKDNSNYGTGVVGTISGTSISFGSATVFASSVTLYPTCAYSSVREKHMVVYMNNSASQGYMIPATISGTSVSFGTAVSIADGSISEPRIVEDTSDTSNGTFVIIHRDSGQDGKAIVAQMAADGAITKGNLHQWEGNAVVGISLSHDTTNNKFLIAFNDSTGHALVATRSGTGFSFGTKANFDSSAAATYTACAFDSVVGKSVIAYTVSSVGKAVVATISGTDVTFGDPVQFEGGEAVFTSAAFNPDMKKVVIAYHDASAQDGKFVNVTISNTTPSFSTPAVFESGEVSSNTTANTYVGNGKMILGYSDKGDSEKGKVAILQSAYTITNLTAENYIGMSGGALDSETRTLALGSATVFEAASLSSAITGSCFDSTNNRVVIVYTDGGNSNYGTAIVGQLDGTAITFGTPVVFESNSANGFDAAFDSNAGRVVVAYDAEGASGGKGTAIVGAVNSANNSISFGTAVAFTSGNISKAPRITFDSTNNKVVILYGDPDNSTNGTCIVGTVDSSDNSISFGTKAAFETGGVTDYYDITFSTAAGKVVIAYSEPSTFDGHAIVGTVSGTGISYGSETEFDGNSITDKSITYDSVNDRVVIAYRDSTSNIGEAIVGTVSGTDITFGSAVTLDSGVSTEFAAAFDPDAGKVVVVYRDNGNSNHGTYILGTVSGTSISFNTEAVFEAASTSDLSVVYCSTPSRLVIAYQDEGNSNYGTSIVLQNAATVLTRGQVASGSSASVDIIGTVSENQTGLTAGQSYFVQTDGTIGLTAGSPSVFAGTAISATKLLVKT